MEDEGLSQYFRDDICQPPKGKSRRSTMFAYRKNRLVDSNSPENAVNRMQDSEGTFASYTSSRDSSPLQGVQNNKWQSQQLASRRKTSPIKKLRIDNNNSLSHSSSCCSQNEVDHNDIILPFFSSPPSILDKASVESPSLAAPRLPLAAVQLGGEKKALPLLPLDFSAVRSAPALLSPSALEPLTSLPQSPAQLTALVAKQKATIEALNVDLANMRAASSCREEMLQSLADEVTRYKSREHEQAAMLSMAREEIATLHFSASLQEQKILELEDRAALAKIEKNEALSHRSRKYKTAINKITKEKHDYEERANAMIQQMNDQMASLQAVAMQRIEMLEKQLMESRRESEELKLRSLRLTEQLERQHSLLLASPSSAATDDVASRRSTASPMKLQTIRRYLQVQEEYQGTEVVGI
eukprot:gene7266-8036_t